MIIKEKHSKLKIKLTDYSVLQDIRDYIKAEISDIGINEVELQKVVLAIDEICTNLIKHALGYKNQYFETNLNFDENISKISEIEIDIEIKESKIYINIIDQTKSFNLLELPETNMSNYFKLFKSGGLGVQLVKLIMDEIKYLPATQNQPHNILLLIKNIK